MTEEIVVMEVVVLMTDAIDTGIGKMMTNKIVKNVVVSVNRRDGKNKGDVGERECDLIEKMHRRETKKEECDLIEKTYHQEMKKDVCDLIEKTYHQEMKKEECDLIEKMHHQEMKKENHHAVVQMS